MHPTGIHTKRENHWTIHQDGFESRVSAGATEKLPGWDKSRAKTSALSCHMEGHARKCMERYCELANKKTEQLYKVFSPCLDDHQIKKEELENKGALSEVCSNIVLKCLYLARIGRLDILWSVQQTGTICHKMDSSMQQTIGTINFLHSLHKWLPPILSCGQCGSTLSIGLLQDSDSAGDLEDSKSTSGGVMCIFGSRTFVPISWMCKKQTWVSRSSRESEIISLDAGLRMDGLLALGLWDLVIEVLWTTHGRPKPTQASTRETGAEIQRTPKFQQVLDHNVYLSNVDQVPSNEHLSERESQLYIFEDKEAVIKMIIKGRSPTLRTRVPHPPSCSGLVVWQNKIGREDSKKSTSIPKTNSQTF